MKKFLLVTLVLIVSIFTFSSCFLVGRYMKSDKELAEHYKNARIKPSYRNSDFKDRKLHYAVMSSNDTLPLLVMIHGAPGAWYGYMNLTDDSLLQQNFKIISVDRLGYGKSGYGKEELSIELQAQAIRHIIEKENSQNKKVYLLGRSYGAPIAAWLAINYPQEVEKLVLASPVIDPDKEKFYWFSELGNTKLVQWMLPDLLNVATREKFSHQQEMKKMLPAWKNLCTPTYVLVGEEDNIADTANFTFARKNFTSCPAVFMKLKNTGHQITQQQPELIKSLLLETSYSQMASLISEEDHHGNLFYDEVENTNLTETSSAKENPESFSRQRKSINATIH
jgi:pimeloyl-ACP methyl ester carboxylesterase